VPKITVMLEGVPGRRKVTATCNDCGSKNNEHPYDWMSSHPAECEKA